MYKNSCHIIEEAVRAKKLREFLVLRNLPLTIWLSEDAARIIGCIQYDSQSN